MGVDHRVVLHSLIDNYYPFNLLSLERATEAVETIRIFELRAGESLKVKGGKSRDYLYILEGEVQVSHDLTDEHIMHAEDTRKKPLFIPPEPYHMNVLATLNSVICLADSVMFDTLLLWDEIAQCNESNKDICDKISGIHSSLAFQRLPLEGWIEAFKRFEWIDVKNGQTICTEGDHCAAIFVLKEGTAEASRSTGDDEIVVADLNAGDVFGEQALVSLPIRSSTVSMTSSGKVLKLSNDDFNEIAEMAHVDEVDSREGKQATDNGAVMLDIRYDMEREESSIPDSTFIPLHDLSKRLDELNRDQELIVYCRSGRRSKAAAWLLQEAGFKAKSLSGGIINWPYDISGDTF